MAKYNIQSYSIIEFPQETNITFYKKDTFRGFSHGNSIIEVIATIFIGIFVTCLSIYNPLIGIALVIIVPIYILIKKNPSLGVLTILILVSSIVFKEALPEIPIGIGSFYIPDVILVYLVFLTFLSRAKSGRLLCGYELGEKILFIFIFTSIFAFFNALYFQGVSIDEAGGEFRIISYYLLYSVIIELFQNEKQLRFLIHGMFVLGIVVGGAMLIQAIIGESIQIMPGRVEAIGVGYYLNSATRILPPGQTLVFFIFLISGSILYLADNYNKLFVYTSFFVCAIGVLLTFNRSYWVAAFFCFLIFFVIAKTNKRVRLFSRLLLPSIIFSLLLVLFFMRSPTGFAESYFKSFEDRLESLFLPKELFSSGSLQWRKRKTRMRSNL